MIIGIDTGYGYTKAAAESGERVLFPSVVGTGFERRMAGMVYDGTSEADNYELVVPGDTPEHYFIGYLALSQARDAARPFSDERSNAEEIRPLLLAAVGALCKGEPVTMVTGLPLEPFFKQAPGLKKSLERLSGTEILLNGSPVKIVFEDVIMFPQAVGALYGHLVRGGIRPSGVVGLVDVGFKTTDIILYDAGAKKPLEGYVDTIPAGTNDVVVAVQDEIKREVGMAPNPEWVEEAVIRGIPLTFDRRKFDVPGMAAAKSAQLAELVASRVARRWSDCLKRLEVVFLAGGGAALVQGAVSRLARCEVMPDSQFANAAGFLAKGLVTVARGKAGNGGD
ncbi:plasmid segregation actin-type ATPase ParM [Desulfofundulus thermosubterraneus DSM 16057]|uniref:Plasmid segregation actin-type ATPase ParM n=2 Tax=Desulfofundulus TaxID=2282741 RepID=A0A1M6JEM4_9FIRM|nr:plasmid segregation actin-type ATPase ParM [Desulfofundulus thermosubterraneus DSM 16057]